MQEPAVSAAISLIIVELAADWPKAPRSAGSSCRVIAQREGEPPREFAQRVRDRLEEDAFRRVSLQSVVLAINERLDPCARAARQELTEAAAGALAAANGGGLRVTASDRNAGRSRRPLTSWLAALGKRWRPRAVNCTLLFSVGLADTVPARAPARRKPVPSAVSDSVRHVA